LVDENSQFCYNIDIATQKDIEMKNGFVTSKGGTVTFTQTGLIHKAGQGAYSGRLAELNQNAVVADAPKRGRGRPKKNA
jgi:hypothetical protein